MGQQRLGAFGIRLARLAFDRRMYRGTGRIVIEPVVRRYLDLDDLVAGITE